jgi:hypothetical protein
MNTKHGDKRNHQITARAGQNVTFRDPRDRVVFHGPTVVCTSFTEERWCDDCQEWQTISGIMGVLAGCPVCKREW